MAIIVALALGMLALAFVLSPLYTHAAVQENTAPATDIRPEEHEQAARVALREVELDYQLGNISETDYTVFRERYMQQALIAMKARIEREQEIDEEIEEQLCRMKEHHENTNA